MNAIVHFFLEISAENAYDIPTVPYLLDDSLLEDGLGNTFSVQNNQ